MPKRVDHTLRRLQIAEALWRIAASRGLEEVSMRQVAAEAGVSTRLVQYYFETRDRLLIEALSLRNEHDRKRIEGQLPEGASLQDAIRVMLLGLLPLDAESRQSTLIQLAYGIRAVNDPLLAEHVTDHAKPGLEELVADMLAGAQAAGQLHEGLDLVREAGTLLALSSGMSYDVLMGIRTADDAVALVDYNLQRVFRPVSA
ncbi:MAG TPA: TetR/AcrR family transcriptional regulator [Mesorhizobium sp.]|jgi:AcrR family transcriptional regulator|uniref:TetR/AcrR family transcriptional regulator n=1 Tax=Mesorhizobium sp. TaxID=1871066 RepID=UPI002DDCD109|nr:TetR/AcrR family transcriptional regulator [Mesorhizobium sp.]HEV2505460.1 TetR/AcrR family transcriptional regulator [Mesorhizobium sp.]